jgi:hypothetical protein
MRVTGLLHYGLEVPAVDHGRDFYTDFGLEVTDRGTTLAVRCRGRDQDQTLLTEGPGPTHLGLESVPLCPRSVG